MPYLQIRHRFEDYLKFKVVFTEHGRMRRIVGSRGAQLFQNADDPHEFIVVIEWDDMERARTFAASRDLREAMERAGLVGEPSFLFVEKLETPSF